MWVALAHSVENSNDASWWIEQAEKSRMEFHSSCWFSLFLPLHVLTHLLYSWKPACLPLSGQPKNTQADIGRCLQEFSHVFVACILGQTQALTWANISCNIPLSQWFMVRDTYSLLLVCKSMPSGDIYNHIHLDCVVRDTLSLDMHILAAFKKRAVFAPVVLFRNVVTKAWLFVTSQCLCPLTPWPSTALPHVVIPSVSSKGKYVRLSGAGVSILFALFLSFLAPAFVPDYADLPSVCIVGAWMVALGAIASWVLPWSQKKKTGMNRRRESRDASRVTTPPRHVLLWRA